MALFFYPMERETYHSLLMRWMQLYHLDWMEFAELIDNERRYLSKFVDHIDFACLISDKLEERVSFTDIVREHSLYNLETYFFNDYYKEIFKCNLESDELSINYAYKMRFYHRINIDTQLKYNDILKKNSAQNVC